MKNILITGGSGLIGKSLRIHLIENGYNVGILSRTKQSIPTIKTFVWNVESQQIDIDALKWADIIIHLAGAGIADKRWTTKRKNEIVNSRVNSANLIFNTLQKHNIPIEHFISASGTGYYGAVTSESLFTELDKAGADFAAQVCVQWEAAASQFKDLNIRTTIVRTGVVLSEDGGALNTISQPIKFGFGSPLGKGTQKVPWIHIDDLSKIYLHIITQKLEGIFNAVADEKITNDDLTKAIAQKMGKRIWLPNVPSFMLKIVLGEMAEIILEGSNVSNQKIKAHHFTFDYPSLHQAFQHINLI